jgi:DNA-binding NarL/FixJ family response regulator
VAGGQRRALKPDVLVLTLNLPAQDREAAIPAIRAHLPELRILALSERGAENCLVLNPPSRKWLSGVPLGTCPVGIDCLQLAAHQGAIATLRRSADPQDLCRAIRAVARGLAWYDPTTAAGMLVATGRERAGVGGRRLFSDREMQVAALIAEGHSNKEIASLLGIRLPTVKKHVMHILEKLGLQDRLQAGLYLARNAFLLKP